MIEPVEISPFAQRQDFKTLTKHQIKQQWPGWRDGGKVKYGCWNTEPNPFECYPPLKQKFIEIVSNELKNHSHPTIADIGCGNGCGFVEGARKITQDIPDISFILTDIQASGLKDAEALYTGPIHSVAVDISQKNAAQKILADNLGNKVDAFMCDSLLHFLPGNKLDTSLQNISAITSRGGYGFFRVCSVYNPSVIGNTGNKAALQIIQDKSENGTTKKPLVFFNPTMNSQMTFFTTSSLRDVLEKHCFTIQTINAISHTSWTNGFNGAYPEHIDAIVQKK